MPRTAAYVPDDLEYDEITTRYLRNPQHVEDLFSTFSVIHKSTVPDDYLCRFKEDLMALECMLDRGVDRPFLKYERWHDLFTIALHLIPGGRQLRVTALYLRPCAHHRAFFRMIIYVLLNFCVAKSFDLIFSVCFENAARILQIAVPECVELTHLPCGIRDAAGHLIPSYCCAPADATQFVVRWDRLRAAGLRAALGIDRHFYRRGSDGELVLDARMFPTAAELNFGPQQRGAGAPQAGAPRVAPRQSFSRSELLGRDAARETRGAAAMGYP